METGESEGKTGRRRAGLWGGKEQPRGGNKGGKDPLEGGAEWGKRDQRRQRQGRGLLSCRASIDSGYKGVAETSTEGDKARPTAAELPKQTSRDAMSSAAASRRQGKSGWRKRAGASERSGNGLRISLLLRTKAGATELRLSPWTSASCASSGGRRGRAEYALLIGRGRRSGDKVYTVWIRTKGMHTVSRTVAATGGV